MALLTLCLLILLPYFNFVFAYLNPISIVDRISTARAARDRARARRHPRAAARRGARRRADRRRLARTRCSTATPACRWPRSTRCRTWRASIRPCASGMPAAWFVVDGELAHDPDFVSMDAARAGRALGAPDLVRDEDPAPVPDGVRRGAQSHPRRQLSDRDQHAPARRGGRAATATSSCCGSRSSSSTPICAPRSTARTCARRTA